MKLRNSFIFVTLVIFVVFILLLTITPLLVLNFKPQLITDLVSNDTLYEIIHKNISIQTCPYPLILNDFCQLPDYTNSPEWRISSLFSAIVFLLINIFLLIIWITYRTLWRSVFLALIVIIFTSILLSILFIIAAYHKIDHLILQDTRWYEQLIGFCLHFQLIGFFLWLNCHLSHVIYILLFPSVRSPLNECCAGFSKLVIALLVSLLLPSINMIFLNGYSMLTFLPLPKKLNGLLFLLILPLCFLNASIIILTALLIIIIKRVEKSVGVSNAIWYKPLAVYMNKMFVFFVLGSLLLDLLLSISMIVKNHEFVLASPDNLFYLAISIRYNSNSGVSLDSEHIYRLDRSLRVLNISYLPLLIWPFCLLCFELGFSWTTLSKVTRKWIGRVHKTIKMAFTPLRSSEQDSALPSSA